MLSAGAGDDVLTGGDGSDGMDGGLGADRFRFLSETDTTGDVLAFNQAENDIIDVSAIDAMWGTGSANEQFTFQGTDAFTGAGQLRYRFDAAAGQTVIECNTDSSLDVDFEIPRPGLGRAPGQRLRVVMHQRAGARLFKGGLRWRSSKARLEEIFSADLAPII